MMHVASSSPVHPGQMLADKYRVERILGSGGMGVVVAARHVELNVLVAIKFLLPHVLNNPEAVARFAREARAAVRIKSEHVARVSDVGTLESGAPYMVMEYLEGTDLASYLRSRTSLPVDKALHFVLQACQAIAEAHQMGIVHRDLKPANLFLTRGADGSDIVKVLDFGISKNIDPDASHGTASMTTAAGALGSPTYMSPEQLTEARQVDQRTDIWALGVILFELLVGSPPFRAENLPKLFLAILHQKPPSPATKRPDLPPMLVSTILRCLEKDRDKRFPNVDAFAASLAEVAPARARLSIERIARLTTAGGVASRSSSHLRSGPPLDPRRAEGPHRPDMLSSADGWGAPPSSRMGGGATNTAPRANSRRQFVMVGVPAALLLASALYWALHRRPVPSNTASIAPSASTLKPAAPKDSAIKTR
jgi:eukaryotic-like serine/threonine-protein kinase